MHPFVLINQNIEEIEKKLFYSFKNRELLLLSFVHRSFVNENRQITKEHNERLEFLGDSVLDLIIAEYLFEKFPKEPEGTLSSYRSFLVDAKTCASYLDALDLGKFVLLGKGERFGDGRGRETILADVFEAIMGAIYLDGGFLVAKKSFFFSLEKKVEELLEQPLQNFKAKLQELIQKKWQKTPQYVVLKETGPEHEKTFFVGVFLDDKKLGEGRGPSKKDAEQAAAKNALESRE